MSEPATGRRQFLTDTALVTAAAWTRVVAAQQTCPDSRQTRSPMPEPELEVAILGGGPAGLSAALVLGRARRRVDLFASGAPRNAPAHAAHSFFTRDGASPAELLRIGREQLRPYDTVQVREVGIASVRRADNHFELVDDAGRRVTAGSLILATGVVDELPDLPGLRELWGTGVFHCPYCHGWEVRDEPFLLLAESEMDPLFARALLGWSSRLTVVSRKPGFLETDTWKPLRELGVTLATSPVVRLIPDSEGRIADVLLENGDRLGPSAAFIKPTLRQRTTFAADLGCRFLEEGHLKGLIDVDERGFTGIPGLYAVGDAAKGVSQIVNAAAAGATAAGALNTELLFAGKIPAPTRDAARKTSPQS